MADGLDADNTKLGTMKMVADGPRLTTLRHRCNDGTLHYWPICNVNVHLDKVTLLSREVNGRGYYTGNYNDKCSYMLGNIHAGT